MASKRMFTVVGVQGVLEVYEDRVAITPKGCLSFFNLGFKGTKTIPFRSITAIQLKEAGLTSGYIQFTLPGGNESRGGLMAATKDENSFLFRSSQNRAIRDVREYIDGRCGQAQIAMAAGPAPEAPSPSVADELLKLAKLKESGALTSAEFDMLKARLFDK